MQEPTAQRPRMYAAHCKDAHTGSNCLQDSHGYPHGPSDAALFIGNAAQTLAAQARLPAGQAIMYPRNDLTYAENFLHMMFAVPSERYEVDPLLARALEVIMIVHMDHEQNASTSTVRTAGGSPSQDVRAMQSAGCCCHAQTGIRNLQSPLVADWVHIPAAFTCDCQASDA